MKILTHLPVTTTNQVIQSTAGKSIKEKTSLVDLKSPELIRSTKESQENSSNDIVTKICSKKRERY